jgi:uncharacterized membrane protein YGL010W
MTGINTPTKRTLSSSLTSSSSTSSTSPLLNINRPIDSRFLKQWSLFADNGTLIDDLSFSYYFHSQDANQWLHLLSLLCIHLALALLLALAYSPASVPVVAIAVFLPYAITLIALEYVSGLVFSAWFTLALVASSLLLQFRDIAWIPALLTLIVMPPMQLVGHVCVERRLPAFRAFEALFTTPTFLMIRALSIFGAFPHVMAEIKKRSVRWRDYRQRTFGNAVIPSTE